LDLRPFDPGTLINWLVSGFIGFLFAAAGTYLTYRLRVKGDITKLESDIELLISETKEKKAWEVLDDIWKKTQDAIGAVHIVRGRAVES
jgi:hypothetical protein